MKRLLILLLFVALSVGTFYAQTQAYDSETVAPSSMALFGVKGGMNISQIAGPDAYDSSDYTLGFNAGLLMQYKVMGVVTLQPELIYTQKGYDYQYLILGVKTKVSDSYDYVELPLLFKLNIGFRELQIQPHIGPSVSYLVRAKRKTTTSIDEISTTHTDDIMDDMRKLDWGLNVGADIVIFDRIMLGGRYNFGMGSIYEKSMPAIGTEVKNGTFMLSLGFLMSR